MRAQSHLVEINTGFIKHKTGMAVPVRLYTHVNKTDDTRRIARRDARKQAEADALAERLKEQKNDKGSE